MKIYDFNGVEENHMRYGGNAGLKKGIKLNDENWFLKFPKNTTGFSRVEISYTSSPLSEYLGSHIYESLEIEAHKTLLGVYDNKLVVACKDFNKENEYLDEYTSIKNDYVSGLEEKLTSSDSNSIDIDEIMLVMDNNPVFIKDKKLKEHFWNMFIVDAFIGNNDRNNGNWGIIVNKNTGEYRVAPVYDNGNAFNNKSSDRQLSEILASEVKFKQSVYDSRTCVFSQNDKDINPLKFIEKANVEECNNAVERIVPRIDMQKIKQIIYELPTEYNGIKVISQTQKEFYIKALAYRYNKVFLPAYKTIKIQKTQHVKTHHKNIVR